AIAVYQKDFTSRSGRFRRRGEKATGPQQEPTLTLVARWSAAVAAAMLAIGRLGGDGAMSFISPQCLGAIAGAILLPATLHAALPTPAEAPERSFLTGQLLIASPSMGDPRFLQTVILMVQHDRNGALGIVINRPVGDRPLARLLEAL